jgi:PAS domain S-box-containing protein
VTPWLDKAGERPLILEDGLKQPNDASEAARAELEQRRHEKEAEARLSSIVESSDDAIVSKDLQGVVKSWNAGAERLFGYSADEVIGRHISIIIPEARRSEEDDILSRIRRGERVDHFETVRRRKDGSLVDISLTVSPVRNADGEIIGASKIARDITERIRAQEQQRLLLWEMNHRVKNLFALVSGIVGLSARSKGTTDEIVAAIQERLSALGRAQDLTLREIRPGGSQKDRTTTLRALADAVLSPYQHEGSLSIEGPDLSIGGPSLTNFALVLHETATNAVKYGALSSPTGRIEVKWRIEDEDLLLSWRESGGPKVSKSDKPDGFGTTLAHAAVAQLGGRLSRDWNPDGLCIALVIPVSSLAP